VRHQFPYTLNNDYDGAREVIRFVKVVDGATTIDLDFSTTRFVANNLVAVLGGAIEKAQRRGARVTIAENDSPAYNALAKVGFVETLGGERLPDIHDTTVPFASFGAADVKPFDSTVVEFIRKLDDASAAPRELKRLRRSLHELFENAKFHGKCDRVYACGQWFPNMDRLDFTVANFGMTFKENVSEYFGKDVAGERAIRWATEEGNTTKVLRRDYAGGIGLPYLREFVADRRGKVQIVSADGYFEESRAESDDPRIDLRRLDDEFPGTFINLELRVESKLKEYYQQRREL
jgi:hypothetical protein